jgi:predicted DCC family thiol-disulfide oxidoreductase YuxK
MNAIQACAPNVGPNDRVVLFDGVCRLCGAWARFLIRFDRRQVFKLATMQSDEGKRILDWYGLPVDGSETMLLIEGGRLYAKSSAFIRVMARLLFPWKAAAIVWLIPRAIRDWLYDRVALNRYAIFGKHQACVLPTPDHERRFLIAEGPDKRRSDTHV